MAGFQRAMPFGRVKGCALVEGVSPCMGDMCVPMQVPGISHLWNIPLFLRYVSKNDSNPALMPHVRDAAAAMRN
ncbi:hypothetical protein GHA01_28410 [Novacetimonas hansenii]|uniref:Uncharacterized protein n=2 Tax=Novacetimonas hansenii TaxID=436 RepID=A0ABQ0SIE5_NOVHA|nr:hypothetical protein Gaha_0018_022 [Novacetimonas hansenii JCM 7643]GBQ55352.1 hypothetical protein AA0243_0883 [Novacetimonas hansenii NRIC 0243]GEC64992.1 hypothetical protein GHA01_28410 [Novacetimonas hansenii]